MTIDHVAQTRLASSTGPSLPGPSAVWAVFGDTTLARIDPPSATPPNGPYAGLAAVGVVEGGGWLWVVEPRQHHGLPLQP